jgi:acyl-coenzyme A thioesterase PaaI-like protein
MTAEPGDTPSDTVHHQDHLDPLIHVAQHDHPDALADARAGAGRAIRDLGHALVGHHASIDLVEHVRDQLNALTSLLEANDARSRADERPTGDWTSSPDDGAAMNSFDERPVSGRASPWGLDLTVRREGDDVVALLTLRSAHEGAPGRSHGGIVAALFDDVYGFVLAIHAQPAFTGELSVRYRAATPIGRELECRVRMTGREGRKILMTGELRDGEQLLVTSTATFIAIDPEQFRSAAS